MKLGKLQREVASIYINMIKENNVIAATKRRVEKVNTAIQELTQNDKLSHNAFWKLKKTLHLNTKVGNSVILKNGVELFGNSAIIEAYRTEFIHRLRTRSISEPLKNYEEQTNSLCSHYTEFGKTQNSIEFTANNLVRVIKTMSKKKAPGPDGLPAEVFIHAGKELISSITAMFNTIKRNGSIPIKWCKVNIKTLYKNKGSQKDLENYRGIFLTPTISKVFERYLMKESEDSVSNISKFQGGSRPNRSASDQLFLLRACIDHANYMHKCLFIKVYDFTQCFDSMWLEDSIISLRNIGIQCDILSLIKSLNETSVIVVKTPVGNTREFTAENIVKQGTVLGPLLCSASTAECCVEHTQGGVNIGASTVRSLAYVDDILDASENVQDAVEAHSTVIQFAAKKRLQLSWKKCAILKINSCKNADMPSLLVDGKPMKIESKVKYLGDIINSKGTHSDMLEERVNKGNGCVVNIFSIVQDITFGCHTIETTLLLYNSLFLATLLYNSQSWSHLNKTEIKKLKVCQMGFLKRILKAPKSAPNALVLLEIGVLPIEYVIYSKKLMFLQHILQLDTSDPVRKVYHEQMQYEYEMNWANEVRDIKHQLEIKHDEEFVRRMTKNSWKTEVRTAVKEAARKKLNMECQKLKNVKRQYADLKTKEYLLKLDPEEARIAFAYRSGVLDIKCQRQYLYNDLVCRACGVGEEDLNHIVNQCSAVKRNSILDIESENLNTITEIVQIIKTFLLRH